MMLLKFRDTTLGERTWKECHYSKQSVTLNSEKTHTGLIFKKILIFPMYVYKKLILIHIRMGPESDNEN